MNEQRSIASAALAAGLFAFGSGEGASAETPCDHAAELFIETGAYLIGNGQSILLEFCGEAGCQQFEFASGSAQSNIIAAINTFMASIGVHAEASLQNPQRIRVSSSMAGDDAFVSVTQVSNRPPRLFSTSIGGAASWRLIAHGYDGLPGDANCDNIVGVADLQCVIGHWGACPASPPQCMGDVDLDGFVNVADLLTVITNWGATQ